MAGVKGRSGGARSGTGPKPKKPPKVGDLNSNDPKVFLTKVMQDSTAEFRARMEAAKALMPFVHVKLGEGGKKDQKQDAAKNVASRFAPSAPPKLVAAGGKKV